MTSTPAGSNDASNNTNKPNQLPVPNDTSNIATKEWTELVTALAGVTLMARFVAFFSTIATACAAPLAVGYLMSTCPTDDSFDTKRELKRVLRGDNLPESHPNKPTGFFGKTMAKVGAAIEAEAATITGYSVEIVDIVGLVKIATVRIPSSKKDYYWLGAANRWRFLMVKDQSPSGEGSRSKTD